MSEQRFDRIENSLEVLTAKVDKMAELMNAIIRMEEKQLAIQHRLDNIDTRINLHGTEIDHHSVQIAKARGMASGFVALAAIFGGLSSYLMGKVQ